MEGLNVYQRAKEIANAKLGFYFHLTIYVVVNILLIIINLVTLPQYLWFKWSLLGWGIGLFFHALGIFIFYGEVATKIKETMVKEEMKKEAKKKQN